MALTDSDLLLKLRMGAIFRRLGYVSFSEVDLCTYTYQGEYRRKHVTDFDVLGVLLEPDLGASIAVAECKTAEERAMESLLKLNGVKQFFGAHKAYFVQQRMDANAREMGGELGIFCLDEGNLASLMRSLDVDEVKDVELETKTYGARAALVPQQKKDLRSALDYLKYDFWTLPDHRNVINLIRLLTQMSKVVDPKNHAHVILLHQTTTALALSILRVAGNILRRNIDNFPDGLLTALLGGSRERRDREVLFDSLARHVSNSSLSIKPEFFDDLAELMQHYLNSTYNAHRVVACLDDMTRRLLVPDIEKREGALTEKYGDRTVKLARDAIYLAVKVGRIPEKSFVLSLGDKSLLE